MKEKLKKFARQMKSNIAALYLASSDIRTPLSAKFLIGLVVAYALSPIDLIPDFIPIIGFLDDVIILPIGIYLAIKMLPEDVWQDCLNRAKQSQLQAPKNIWAGSLIIVLWVLTALALGFFVWPYLRKN